LFLATDNQFHPANQASYPAAIRRFIYLLLSPSKFLKGGVPHGSFRIVAKKGAGSNTVYGYLLRLSLEPSLVFRQIQYAKTGRLAMPVRDLSPFRLRLISSAIMMR